MSIAWEAGRTSRRRVARGLFGVLFLLCFRPAEATNHVVRINEVMAGLNGDSSIQFLEMVASDDGQKAWGSGRP